MDQRLIKEGLGIDEDVRIAITPVAHGWNIRIKQTKKPKVHKRNKDEMTVAQCAKCGTVTYCHYHHVIPVSAGGGDESDNKRPLCFDDHVGDNGIHHGKWKIEDIIPAFQMDILKERYKK